MPPPHVHKNYIPPTTEAFIIIIEESVICSQASLQLAVNILGLICNYMYR